MNVIRLYCDSRDIRIKGIINHFMRCIGLYVIEVYDEENNEIDSICDIYVVSEYYEQESIDVKNEKKSILILADGRDIDDQQVLVKKLYYEETDMEEFLTNLIYEMGDIFEDQKLLEKRLIYADLDYLQVIYKIIHEYTKNKIFECSAYVRYFFSDEVLFRWSMPKYKKFIEELQMWNLKKQSDLIKYTVLYIMYEIDIMCKKNSYQLLFSPEEIINNCNILLMKYESNEQLLLLRADTHNELLGFGAKATNEYGNNYLQHCSYAHYKRGRAYRKYIGDMMSAEISIKNALNLNKLYYNAWYQDAMCLAYKKDFIGETEALINIFIALNDKWKENILSPLELEYLYKAFWQLEQITVEHNISIWRDYEHAKLKELLNDKCFSSKYVEYMGFLKDENLKGVEYRNIEMLRNIKEHICIR